VELSRHSEKSLSFDLSYMFTRDLSNAGGVAPTAFAVAGGSYLTDRFNPGLDYGNVIYDRRQRFLATYLYNLPSAAGQRWLTKSSAARALAGNWQLAGVTVFQSGPFLTPYEQSLIRRIRISSPPSASRARTSCRASRPTRRRAPRAVARPCGVSLPESRRGLQFRKPDWHRPLRQRSGGRRGGTRHGKLLAIAHEGCHLQ